MKKVLFLLLVTSISYGQALFDKGIKVTTNINDTIATKVVVKSANNVYNYQDIVKFQKEKGFLSTGLIKNGLISANGDPTKFNITAGVGIISNFDNPENPISTVVRFPAFNSITPTYLTTGNITYVAINSTPAVVMQATPFTPVQRRSLIILGAVIHSNLTTINVLNNISAPTNADTNQLHDFMEAIGALNLTGNKYTENGANLQLNKSAGVLFKLGSNFAVDWKNPHQIAQAEGTAITFRYRTQNGTESADMTSISPGLYDLNNVLTTVPNNKFTIQTVTVFQTGLTRIQWGQSLYDDLQSAKNALLTRDFVVENNIKENGVTRAYIIVRNTTTSLQNVADAYISEAQKFGGVASGGVALTLANIVTALGYTPENVANKTGTLTASSVLYPNNDAVIAGLALKQNVLTNPITGTGTSNTIPKFTGTTTQGNSNITDNGTLVSTSTDMTINGVRTGRGGGNLSTNLAFGTEALRDNLTGTGNIAIGATALRNNLNSNNLAIGTGSAQNGANSNNNLSIGNFSLLNNSAGINNTVIGLSAGRFISDIATNLTNVNNGLFIGALASPLANSSINEIVIAPNGKGLGNNTTVLGNSSTSFGRWWGRLLIGKSADDGVNDIQANSFISSGDVTLGSSQPTANNQVTRKDYVDTALALKANISSQSLQTIMNNDLGSANSSNIFQVYNPTSLGLISVNNTEANGVVVGRNDSYFKTNDTEIALFSGGVGIPTTKLTISRTTKEFLLQKNFGTKNLVVAMTQTLSGFADNTRVTIPAMINSGNYRTITERSTSDGGALTYTVATLPTGALGDNAIVSDATAPTYLGALIGGGSVTAPVWHNGTTWVSR